MPKMPKKQKHQKPRLTIMSEEDQELAKLGPEDVCVIIRKNLDMELFVPNREDDAIIEDAEMHGFAIMMALADPELSQKILDLADQKMQEAQQESELESKDDGKEKNKMN